MELRDCQNRSKFFDLAKEGNIPMYKYDRICTNTVITVSIFICTYM